MKYTHILFGILASTLIFPTTGYTANSDACFEEIMGCICVDSFGEDVVVEDDLGAVNSGELCEEECRNTANVSWKFYCGDSDIAFDMGDIDADTTETADATSAATTEATKKEDAQIPVLNVPIPGLDLAGSVLIDESGNVMTNMIGLYVNAVFRYGLVIATIFAVLMLTIGGFQYMTAGGSKSAVTKAKARIENTLIGLALLMATYAIAFFIDPRLTRFDPLDLEGVKEIQLQKSTSGAEGSGTGGSSGTWGNLSEPYRTAVENAKKSVECSITGGISSPTGYLPNQRNHHWYTGSVIDYTKVFALDWAAGWGTAIKAPFDGTVTHFTRSKPQNCGNTIILKTGNRRFIICHAKDFVDDAGNLVEGWVKRGDTIGHVGGLCCAGETSTYQYTQCTHEGTKCTDPEKGESCSCQSALAVGNVTNPHVHLEGENLAAGEFLSCLE